MSRIGNYVGFSTFVAPNKEGTGNGIWNLMQYNFFRGGGSKRENSFYFSSSPVNITVSDAEYDKIVIIAGTGASGNAGSPGGGPGGNGGGSNVRAYIDIPVSQLSGGPNSLTVPSNYLDPFYSSAVQMAVPGGSGPGGALSVTNSNGTPYSNINDVITALNNFTSSYQFSAQAGGAAGSGGASSFGWGGGGGQGGRGGLSVTLQPPSSLPPPSSIRTPLPPTTIGGNNGNNGGNLFKDPASFANGGTGGTGGTGIGAGGGGGGGGGGTPWGDWPSPSAPGGSGGAGASSRVFIAIEHVDTAAVWWTFGLNPNHF
jgi:hypothetical protein